MDDLQRLLGLVRYGQLEETGEYDYSKPAEQKQADPAVQRVQNVQGNRQVNNQGDNPMIDPQALEEGDCEPVKGQDYTINWNGPKHVTVQYVGSMVVIATDSHGAEIPMSRSEWQSSLVNNANREGVPATHTELDEFDTRVDLGQFTYVTDTMGNVTVQDAVSGKSVYLTGSDAMELLGQLQMHGGTPDAEQAILSQYQHVME